MRIIKSCIVAFSMYSKIPMPQFEWKEEEEGLLDDNSEFNSFSLEYFKSLDEVTEGKDGSET